MQTIKEIFENHCKEANIALIDNISNSEEIGKTIQVLDVLTFETRKLAIKREARLTREIFRLQEEILTLKADKC